MSYGVSYTWDRQGNRFWMWREGRPRDKGGWASPVDVEFIKALSHAAFNVGRMGVIAGHEPTISLAEAVKKLDAIAKIASGEEPVELPAQEAK